jgi:hypothetical protein
MDMDDGHPMGDGTFCPCYLLFAALYILFVCASASLFFSLCCGGLADSGFHGRVRVDQLWLCAMCAVVSIIVVVVSSLSLWV